MLACDAKMLQFCSTLQWLLGVLCLNIRDEKICTISLKLYCIFQTSPEPILIELTQLFLPFQEIFKYIPLAYYDCTPHVCVILGPRTA